MTAVGHGLAFPHMRGVEEGVLTFACGVSPSGIDWGGERVNLVFFTTLPVVTSPFYLKLLAAAKKNIEWLKGECGRLQGEARKAALAANKPTGELDRRRAELKQAMKDCGYYTDPKSIERLGFKLVSGRTHWKLEYGNVRMPIAKTPSDYRANLNMATDLANRCF